MRKLLLSILVLGMASSAIAQTTIPSAFQGNWIKSEAFAKDRYCENNDMLQVFIRSYYIGDGEDVMRLITSLKTISNKAIVLTTSDRAMFGDTQIKVPKEKLSLNLMNQNTLSINGNTYERCLNRE